MKEAKDGYDPREQDEVLEIFTRMLRAVTSDGAVKRAAGEKPSWKDDPDHEAAVFSHLSKWKHGELIDADSGSHPMVHLAWRALAIAWQETPSFARSPVEFVEALIEKGNREHDSKAEV